MKLDEFRAVGHTISFVLTLETDADKVIANLMNHGFANVQYNEQSDTLVFIADLRTS